MTERVIEGQHYELLSAIDKQGEQTTRAIDRMATSISQLAATMEHGFESLSKGNGDSKHERDWDWRLATAAAAVLAFVFSLLMSQLGAVDQRLSAASKDNRLNVASIESRLGPMMNQIRALEKTDEEIEAQFCAASIVENMRQQYMQGLLSIAWPKDAPKMPVLDYWPSVGKRCAGSSG